MKSSTLYSIAAVLTVAALFFLMTTARARVQCHVCMEYKGRSNCASAIGPTRDAAGEAAQTTACGPIASGMDQQIECSRTPPASAECRTH
jgi:hypothetical protein